MDFSVVILTFNSQRYIEKCLTSLISAFDTLQSSYEIFVIDNGSVDQSCAIVERIKEDFNANVILEKLGHNTGTTYSRNIGLKRSTGDYVIIMDSDAYGNAETIDGLRQYLIQHSNCGMAVPKLTYPDGRFQLSTDTFPTLRRKAQRMFFLKDMERTDQSDGKEAVRVDYAISAFWMFPRKVLEKVGMLDEKIFYAPEDVDYCLRVWKAGFSINYLPMLSMVHDAQELSRGFKINKFTFLHIQGLLYYFIKHRYFWGLSRIYRRLGLDYE